MSPRLFPVTAVFALTLCGPGVGTLRADPIQVTSGVFSIEEGDPAFFQFAGANFNTGFTVFLSTFIGQPGPGNFGGGIGPFETCFTCAPGATIDLSSRASGLIGNAITAADVGGTSYAPVFYFGELTFDAPRVTAPPLDGSGNDVVNLIAPFAFNGQLTAFASADRTGPELFSVLLNGGGNVDLQISGRTTPSGRVFGFEGLNYRFTSAAVSPTPEPGTLLLMASGLLGARAIHRRRLK